MYYGEEKIDKAIREKFFPDFDYKGIMVEVGAGPTTYFSMSKHFRDNGWRCILVEPNPKFVEFHKSLGHEIYPYACSSENKDATFTIVSTPTWHEYQTDGCSISAIEVSNQSLPHMGSAEKIPVKLIKLDTLLEDLKIEKIDYLSIDVEGWEIDVMKGFSPEKYSPKIIVLENIGHSSKYSDYMNSIGFILDSSYSHNQIYIKQ